MGEGSTNVLKMSYKQLNATTEPEVANLMGQYVEDSFKLLEEDDINCEIFWQIEQEWLSAQDALDSNLPPS